VTRNRTVVVVGSSAGGLRALEMVLGKLPSSFPLPIVAVQHRSKESSDAYADVLGAVTKLPVRDAEDNTPLDAPGVYVGPPDYHVLLEPGRIVLSVDEPVAYSRPSIDVLFESAADAYGSRVVGILLTGANQDGARGLVRIKQAGGYAIVQDPHTAESPEMPAAGIAQAPVDCVLPLAEIADALLRRTAST
jgi:two-component system chemotaxis response regulator CheB